MKAVDILIAARARLSNKLNWTTGSLVSHRAAADNGRCFCSIGGVLEAGGAFGTKGTTNFIQEVLQNVSYESDVYGSASRVLNSYFMSTNDNRKSVYDSIGAVSAILAKQGVAFAPTVRALDYLQSAAKTAFNLDVINVNDAHENAENHKRVLAMFDLAIANAKRRHKNGKRYAADPVRSEPVRVAIP